jgi:hypothetical protein
MPTPRQHDTNADRQAAYRARHADKDKLQGMLNSFLSDLNSHPRIATNDRAALSSKLHELETLLQSVKLVDL